MSITKVTSKSGKTRFKAQIWHKNQRIATKTFDRMVDAKEWEKRKKVQLLDSSVGREKGKNVSLNDFFYNIYWPNKNVREGTAIDYRRIFQKHVEKDLGKRFMSEVSEEDWAVLFQKLKKSGLSGARVNRIHSSISAIISFAVRWRYLNSNPLKLVPYFKEKIKKFDYWTIDEARSFLMWAKETECPRFSLYHATYELGLRMEEVVALTRDSFNFSQKHVHIRQSFCKASKQFLPLTKSGHERILGLNPGLIQTISEYLKTHDNKFVFVNHRHQRVTHDSLRHHFRRDQEKAGMRPIRFHDLRHSFASHFMMNNGNIYDLKSLLGHSDISTTMRYAHLSPEHLKKQASLVSFDLASQSENAPELDNVVPLRISRSISAP